MSLMITDADRKSLQSIVGKRGAVGQITIVCGILFLCVIAMVKLWLASLWAKLGGVTFAGFLRLWFNGVSTDDSYSGAIIRAGDDISAALLYIGMALIFGVLLWRGRKAREQTQRIINTLKSGAVWQSDDAVCETPILQR